jgi:acetyl esterase/lipase
VFNAAGYHVYVLVYRLPGEGWADADVPLMDAQRAMRVIRSRAAQDGVSAPNIGRHRFFRRGGHLAASLLTGFDEKLAPPWIDAIDRMDRRGPMPRYWSIL